MAAMGLGSSMPLPCHFCEPRCGLGGLSWELPCLAPARGRREQGGGTPCVLHHFHSTSASETQHVAPDAREVGKGSLDLGSANIFHEAPDRKYFRLCEPYAGFEVLDSAYVS